MTGIALYELANQFRALEGLALSEDLPPELIRDTIDGLEGLFEDKAVAVAKFILSLEANADAIAEAAAAMKVRADRVQRRADSVRAYLLFNLQSVDRKRIETKELVIKRANNPPAVQVTDENLIPRQYWVQPEPPPERLDKKAIKNALQSGETIAGAFLESSERIVISL